MSARPKLMAVPPAGVTGETTDIRNAERLVELHGADLRHVGTWGKDISWDGRRWAIDDESAAMRAAVETARTILGEATVAMKDAVDALASVSADDVKKSRAEKVQKSVEKRFAWAMKSQTTPRLAAMLTIARTDARVVISHASLDADPWLLNVANGTIDLRTGELRPHARGDLLTKMAPAAYDPDATAPTWEAFLDRCMGGDRELVEYLQRLVGYALTGDVREHLLVFNFGAGANGKSTFTSTIHAVLGEYSTPAPRGLLFRSRGERHPTEFASLHGRRFVTCSEIEEGQAFDEALTKDLTGGDPIECRRMREDFWQFTPTHKLFLAGNHKPTVRGDDEGIWRRMRLVPWVVTIPPEERDKALAEKLRAELPGVLAWAVRGCLEWQAKGLGEPAAVKRATAAYREENDGLGEFLRLHVVFTAEATVSRKALRELYENFCKENGSQPFASKRFAGRLREQGVRETSVREGLKVVDGWRGVRLATDKERSSCRDEGTCRDHLPDRHDAYTRTISAMGESGPTRPYVPTADGLFADWLKGEGVGS